MVLYKLVEKSRVEPGYLGRFDCGGRSIILAAGEETTTALLNWCPHANGRFDEGRVVGNRLRCPQHGYLFDLATGECPRGRRDGFGGLRFVDLQEVDEYYAVELA